MLALKPAQIDFEPRSKTKGKGGSAKLFHVKRTVKEEERRVSDSIIYWALYSIMIIKSERTANVILINLSYFSCSGVLRN